MEDILKRLLASTCAVTIAALANFAVAEAANPNREAAPSQHLFVSLASKTATGIFRFPFVNGVPSKESDLRYESVLFPLAVGHDGTLYASVPLSCCQGEQQIDVFPPDSNNIGQKITLPDLGQDTTTVSALAEGPDGYFYVGYSAFISGARGSKILVP